MNVVKSTQSWLRNETVTLPPLHARVSATGSSQGSSECSDSLLHGCSRDTQTADDGCRFKPRSHHMNRTELAKYILNTCIPTGLHIARTGVRELCDPVRCACSQSVHTKCRSMWRTCAGLNAHVTLTQSSQFKFLMQYRSILLSRRWYDWKAAIDEALKPGT